MILLNAWRSRSATEEYNDISSLTVVADICYSGAWSQELKMQNILRLTYQATSRADETAYVVDDSNISRSLLMRKSIKKTKNSRW
jgi:hypothetical protein